MCHLYTYNVVFSTVAKLMNCQVNSGLSCEARVTTDQPTNNSNTRKQPMSQQRQCQQHTTCYLCSVWDISDLLSDSARDLEPTHTHTHTLPVQEVTLLPFAKKLLTLWKHTFYIFLIAEVFTTWYLNVLKGIDKN